MEDTQAIIQIVASSVSSLVSLGLLAFALIKLAPEREQLKASIAETHASTASEAAQAVQVALMEVRAELAQHKEKLAEVRRERIEKDIQHDAEIRDHKAMMEQVKADLETERQKRRKLQAELDGERQKREVLEKALADMTRKYEEVVKENHALRDRIKALESKSQTGGGERDAVQETVDDKRQAAHKPPEETPHEDKEDVK